MVTGTIIVALIGLVVGFLLGWVLKPNKTAEKELDPNAVKHQQPH